MKNKPSFDQPPERGWTDAAARRAAGNLTRRSVLCRLGYAAAAALGANFLVANGPKASATVVAKPPCQLDTDIAKGCGKTGLYCGLTGPAICSGPIKVVPDCIKAGGCPAGTAPYSSWTACCQCPNQANTGLSVTYTDCCGTVDASKCENVGVTVNPPCTGAAVSCPGCYASDWCGIIGFGGGAYVCTLVSAGAKCTPAA